MLRFHRYAISVKCCKGLATQDLAQNVVTIKAPKFGRFEKIYLIHMIYMCICGLLSLLKITKKRTSFWSQDQYRRIYSKRVHLQSNPKTTPQKVSIIQRLEGVQA